MGQLFIRSMFRFINRFALFVTAHSELPKTDRYIRISIVVHTKSPRKEGVHATLTHVDDTDDTIATFAGNTRELLLPPSKSRERPMNHSLINASGNTHAKIALLAVAVSVVFMAVVSASGVTKSDARTYGTVVKAPVTTTVAGGAIIR